MSLLSRRSWIVLAAVSISVLAAGVAAPPALAAEAAIGGTVLAADTGAPPVGGACVYAYTAADGGLAAGTCIDVQTGAYTIDGLTAGVAYRIQVAAEGQPYPREMWFPAGQTINDAEQVTAPATADVQVPFAGTFTGTLLRSDGQPAGDETVTLYRADRYEGLGLYTTTAADGTWTLDRLFPASHTVSFGCCAAQWAFGKTSWDTADRIAATSGAVTRVDDTLYQNGTISGTVTDAFTGQPVEGICTEIEVLGGDSGGGFTGECSDASGSYQLEYFGTADADLRLLFTDSQGRYVAEYYDDVPASDPASATVVHLPRGGHVTGIDAALTPGGVLTGRVLDAATRKPIPNICPFAYAGRTGAVLPRYYQGCSQDDGVWRLGALPSGDVTIYLMGDGIHVGTWVYSSATQARATVFPVTAGRTTTVRDVKLALGGKISGVVTDARTGAPVPNAYVTVDDFNPRSGPLPGPRSAQTDSAGRYTLGGLASGDYTPLTYEESGNYGFEWSGNADSKATATAVSVRAGRTTGYDVALDPAAIVTGTALAPTGVPSGSYALVDALTSTGDPVGWSTDIQPDGTFRITGLPGGTTYLRLTHFAADGTSVVLWHDAATSRQLATPISTGSGQTTAVTTHVSWS